MYTYTIALTIHNMWIELIANPHTREDRAFSYLFPYVDNIWVTLR